MTQVREHTGRVQGDRSCYALPGIYLYFNGVHTFYAVLHALLDHHSTRIRTRTRTCTATTTDALTVRAQEYAGIPNTRISTQALSRVFQQLLIWKTLEYDVF